MDINLKSIRNTQFIGKTVLLRADLDVVLKSEEISDDLRLTASLETINYLLRKTKTIIIIGHLGRPEGEDKKLSLEVVARWYVDKLKGDLRETKVKGFTGWEIIPGLVLLENLRFYAEEEKNDEEFSKRLASLADVYVNDAFASSHRTHASIVGITKYLPSFAGLRLQKEVAELSNVLNNPKRPLTVVIGGAKIETKLPLVEKMNHFADYVLVGGEIAENDKALIKVQHEKITGKKSIVLVADLTGDKKEITEKSAENFVSVLGLSATIVWNGPMGQIENEAFQEGTEILANGIISSKAYTVVGGGDTLGFLKTKNMLDKFSFVSTGGGAMLEFLAGVKLPGLGALEKKSYS